MIKTDFKIVNKTNSFSIYYYEENLGNKIKYELLINFDLFNMIYLVNNKKIIEFNEKNLLNIEIPYDFTKNENEAMSSIKLDIKYNKCQKLYGLPERAGGPNLIDTDNENLYRLFNIDYFKYRENDYLGLYGSWPFVLGVSESIYSGFIWNNPSETYVKVETIDDDKELLWIGESGIIDISFFADYNLNNFYKSYHNYIGFADIPPMFSLGYHQSRWNYKDIADLVLVDKKFDEFDIPYDTIWLDIEVTMSDYYSIQIIKNI